MFLLLCTIYLDKISSDPRASGRSTIFLGLFFPKFDDVTEANC
jgi:hypothetical protein